MKDNKNISGWILIPGIGAIFLATAIAFLNLNIGLFYMINTFSKYTGSWFWANITIFGDTLVFVVLFLPFIRKNPKLIYAMLIALVVSTLLIQIPKHIFDILRPPGLLGKENITIIGPAYSYNAFPSGHSASVFCLYVLFMQLMRSHFGKILLLLLCITVVLSRIVVGIHWPLDVAAGAAIGIFSGYIAVYVIQTIMTKTPVLLHLILSTLLIASALVLLIPYNSFYEQAFWLQRAIAVVCLAFGIPEYMKVIQNFKSNRESAK